MGTESLIDWDDPERNTHILDWRSRARDFGLLPVADGDGETDGVETRVPQAPEQLLHDEEPEAFDDQAVDDDDAASLDAGDASGAKAPEASLLARVP
jgi:hypothetical protein